MRMNSDRPILRSGAAASLSAAVLVLGLGAAPAAKPSPAAFDEATVTHVLNRVAFGPSARETARLRELGLTRYLDEQLRPDTIADAAMAARLAGLETVQLSSRDISERYYGPMLEMRQTLKRAKGDASPEMAGTGGAEAKDAGPLANLTPEERQRVRAARQQSQRVLQELGSHKLLRAVYSERQLQEVLVDFWFNHFNVFAGKGPVQAYLTEYEREAIRPHVLGSFRELLGAVAHSPAMLFYLDNWQSSDPNMAARLNPAGLRADARNPGRRATARGRFAGLSEDERARRLEEAKPRMPRMPRGLNENYARELLELHTLGVDSGYTQQDIVEVARAFTGWTIRGPRQGGSFWFDDRRHVKGAKHVLGATIDRGGEQDGEAVLDLLVRQPATATFIVTKLARRFVADEPPAGLVARAAETFRRTHGDLREVTRVIVSSPELLAAEARRAKVKTPFEFVASALRASGADVTDAAALLPRLKELGMPLYFAQPPTGYADRADAWVNTGALLARMNFALSLVDGRIPGTRIDLTAMASNGTPEEIRARLVHTLLAGEASESTRRTLDKGAEPAKLAALALGSPEFQRR
jgi:uncharacterized protein (DUF1800 family)